MNTKSYIATATRMINAPAKEIYKIIADYQAMHFFILPKRYFLSLDVEEGGFGQGTIVNFDMRILGRMQSFRALVTEPQPGRVLVETDIRSETSTSFTVIPTASEHHTRVTISTDLKNRSAVEILLARFMLQKIYRDELELLAKVAEEGVKLTHSSTATKTKQTI